MAGDWIKMRTNLRTHPKVVRMASALRADRLRVIGGLHSVWCLFDAHSADGRLDGYTAETLDEDIGWPGFSAAMIAVEWLEDDGDSLSTPRFDEHNGQSAKRRCQEAERKRNERKASARPSAQDADKKRTREEKRREEKIEDKNPLGASAPTDAGTADPAQDDPPAKPEKPKPESVDELFERAWESYPARHGGNPKRDALHAWNARVREGVDPSALIEGVDRYAKFCRADGKVGTPYVMQAATFFGPSLRFAEEWACLPSRQGRPSINDIPPPGAADDDVFGQLSTTLP